VVIDDKSWQLWYNYYIHTVETAKFKHGGRSFRIWIFYDETGNI